MVIHAAATQAVGDRNRVLPRRAQIQGQKIRQEQSRRGIEGVERIKKGVQGWKVVEERGRG